MGGSIYHCYFLLMATDQAHVALAKYKKFPWMIWNVSRNEWNGAVGVKKIDCCLSEQPVWLLILLPWSGQFYNANSGQC